MKPYNREDSSKSSEIEEMFDRIAPTYDMLNHTLSFNIDKAWRCKLVSIIKALRPRKVLDMATGTGDVAIALCEAIAGVEVVGVDLSEGMLRLAREKSTATERTAQITFTQGRAETLAIESESFDVVTAAFGVRNFEDVERGIEQMVRTLRSAGSLVVLEFSTPQKGLFAWVYKLYSYRMLPLIASLFARGDRSAYDYLPASVDEFYSPEEFMELMSRVGLVECKKISLTFGVAHIYIGVKV